MSPATLQYLQSEPYQRYKNGPRPDTKMPPLDVDENGIVTLVPGELYCRWRDLRGTLCPKNKRFNSHTALNSHLKEVHKHQVAARRRGNFNFSEDQNVQDWYTEMDAGRMPSWPLRQGEEAVLEENSARDDSEPSYDGVLPAGSESSRPVDAGDIPQASRDGVLSAGTEGSVHPDNESPRSVDRGGVPQGANEPEESRPQSSVGASLSTPVKQELEVKSEPCSDDESLNLGSPLRMDLPWDANGDPDRREMRRLCDKDDTFRCHYCQEKNRECPGALSNDRCEIWSRFIPPSLYAPAPGRRPHNTKEEIDEDDFMPSVF
ncbi:hypothetical protein KAF25_008147 [Fusarium avenaceum]|uniref:Uncharacterized protein n=1 Tax=Fusarium avenaceum TaxID=40199 RepID=A0A9P7HDI6_9HYPO|nr:hypothetical protein KAF25_008147 [Fusarium avenaceum]